MHVFAWLFTGGWLIMTAFIVSLFEVNPSPSFDPIRATTGGPHHCQEAMARADIDAKHRALLCGGDDSYVATLGYGLHDVWRVPGAMLGDVMMLYVAVNALVCVGLAAYLNGPGQRPGSAAARPATRQARLRGGSTGEAARYNTLSVASPEGADGAGAGDADDAEWISEKL